MSDRIKLGHTYKDRIHGIVGIANCDCRYLTGCDRVELQYVRDGEVKEIWSDATMVDEVLEGEDFREPIVVPTREVAKDNGGPRKPPPSRNP